MQLCCRRPQCRRAQQYKQQQYTATVCYAVWMCLYTSLGTKVQLNTMSISMDWQQQTQCTWQACMHSLCALHVACIAQPHCAVHKLQPNVLLPPVML